MEYVTLNNGIKMPKLGYGVYQLSNEECERCVLDAMEENINVFDFALDASDMNAIRALDEKESLFFSHYDPAIAEMMIKLH